MDQPATTGGTTHHQRRDVRYAIEKPDSQTLTASAAFDEGVRDGEFEIETWDDEPIAEFIED